MKRKSAVLALAVVVLSVTAVQAVPTTYVYTGNPFTDVSGPYSTSDFVTAMVTLASPLADNMPLTDVTPVAFSLSDGVQTITNQNATAFFFQFATDGAGLIDQWNIIAIIEPPFPALSISTSSFTLPPLPPTAQDSGTMANDEQGVNFNSPGTWSAALAPDAGSSLALLSLSLTALGVAARQLKRAAA